MTNDIQSSSKNKFCKIKLLSYLCKIYLEPIAQKFNNMLLLKSGTTIPLEMVVLTIAGMLWASKIIWRWLLYFIVVGVGLLVTNVLDFESLFGDLFLSSISPVLEFIINLVSIIENAIIVFVPAKLIFKNNNLSRVILVIAILSTIQMFKNLYTYHVFTLMPMGSDIHNLPSINWWATIVYFIIYELIAFIGIDFKEIKNNKSGKSELNFGNASED